MTQNPRHSHTWYQLKIHVSPLSNQKAHVLAKLGEIRQPFFDLNYEKWKLQISQRIAQNPLNSPTPTGNHMKLAKFMLISNDSLSPFRVYKFALISHF